MPKKFTLQDGYTTKDLLHYGLDHIACSLLLLKKEPRAFDSAGYLAHLGIELFLKSIMLHKKRYFIGSHSLNCLLKKINYKISKKNEDIFNRLEKFNELRYPNLKDPQDIGSDDGPCIKNLSEEIISSFPDQLKKEFDEINPNEKGNRILMQKNRQKGSVNSSV